MRENFTPKLFSLLKQGISREQIQKDLMAGLIVGIVALPLAIAFAIASGVSPEKGIITAIVAGLVISVLGGSRVQIGGPTGAFIVIVYAVVQDHGVDGLIHLKLHQRKQKKPTNKPNYLRLYDNQWYRLTINFQITKPTNP